ncbi:HD domain-containing protein [Actinomyces slackii]|uniref:PII uridylyl-transferase n=1 Tax=Actinomyces slackii TaxID=52774 RepID=A0A448KFC1_9ACTO|nr:HD domain-containing protein [Actinomyces slackii]VEG75633.1 PII uridylyl-transferase [Actinomyces slackii]
MRPSAARPLSPALAARRHPHPRPWTPQAGRGWRRTLSQDVEASIVSLWAQACGAVGLVDDDGLGHAVVPGLALACVGSLARRETGPASDLDLVLLHAPASPGAARAARLDAATVAALAERLWYPLWDAGIALDHSVRTIEQVREVAGGDLPAAVGMLDLRHLAGDASLTQDCAAMLLGDWRRATRKRLPDLARDAAERAEMAGDLVTLIEPDLKEAHGGLRDAVLIEALAASSLADRPHGQLDRAVDTLLNARDALALVTGRPTSKLLAAAHDEVAERLGITGSGGSSGGEEPRDALLRGVYEAGREVASALDTTMRAALRAARPARRPLTLVRFGRRSAPVLESPDAGVAILDQEVVLSNDAAPEEDPVLPLRVALVAASRRLPVAAVTRRSLARCPVPTAPWSELPARPGAQATALDLFVDLLGTGKELIRVWEDLDLADLPARWLPGWREARNRPQRNPIHLYTVDRHMVRTAALAGELLDDPGLSESLGAVGLAAPQAVEAPQWRRCLLLAAVVHDLGKAPGVLGEAHAAAGVERLPALWEVLGIAERDAQEIALLVRHHLLLATAAGQAPGCAEAVDAAREALGTGPAALRRLAQLTVLTEADARAAGPRAWSPWRASLVAQSTAALARALG